MCAPLVVSVILGVAGRRLGDLLSPATAVPLLTLAGLVTALSTGFVLAVAGFEALAQLPVVASLGAWSARVVAAQEPAPMALGAACALTCVALLGAALLRFVSAGRDLAAAEATCRRLGRGTDGLVVLATTPPTPTPCPA